MIGGIEVLAVPALGSMNRDDEMAADPTSRSGFSEGPSADGLCAALDAFEVTRASARIAAKFSLNIFILLFHVVDGLTEATR